MTLEIRECYRLADQAHAWAQAAADTNVRKDLHLDRTGLAAAGPQIECTSSQQCACKKALGIICLTRAASEPRVTPPFCRCRH
jgi:hypothetical protein